MRLLDKEEIILRKIVEQGLKDYLISENVNINSINQSQSEVATNHKELDFYYHESTVKETNNKIIEVKDIQGVSRAEGVSWFDLMNYGILGSPTREFNLVQLRFLRQLFLLEEYGIEGIQEIYNTTPNISFRAYHRGSEVKYFQITDGNHRTINARVLGLKTIFSDTIYHYDFCEKDYSNFIKYKESDENLKKVLEQSSFENKYGYIIFDSIVYQQLARYPFDSRKFKNNSFEVIQMIENARVIKKRIIKIENKANFYYKIYGLFPKKLLQVRKLLFSWKISTSINEKDISKMIALNKIIEKKL